MENIQVETVVCPICRGNVFVEHSQGQDFEYESTGQYEWHMKECATCSLLVLNPRPAETELSRIYPNSYYAYDFLAKKHVGYTVKSWLDRFSARMYLDAAKGLEGNILDVGCGDGRLLSVFQQTGHRSEVLFGVELDEKAVQAARDKGFQVFHGRIEDSEYTEGSFKLIILQQVIEHVSDPVVVLRRLQRLLVPGGILVLETPNIDSWDHQIFKKRFWGGYHFPRHFHLFSLRSMRLFLKDSDLEVVKIESLPSPSFWIQSVHHACKEKRWSIGRRIFHPHRPSVLLLVFFTLVDSLAKVIHHTSNMRVIVRRRV